MKTQKTFLTISTTLLVVLMSVTEAQLYPPSPSPAEMVPGGPGMAPTGAENDCFTKVLNMSDCLSYVEEGSNVTEPDKNCCPELAGLVESYPICLCELLGSSDQFGVKIERSKALKLPSVCRVSTPPLSLCAVAGYPVAAPSGEPSSAPTAEATPNPSPGDKGAAVITSSAQPLLLGLAFALLVSFF